jgi:acyl carrier protein
VAASDGKPAAVGPVAAAPSSGNGSEHHEPQALAGGAPPVEVFREDLLQAISERTGYPPDMLNEKLELEAGLGIDSIKTIEIFGLLSKYHAYLPGASEDQEESLAAFAKLRTIGDIVAAYASNRLAKQANGAQEHSATGRAATGQAASAGADGQPAVERATLRAVQAAAPSDGGQKKNSPKVTSF